MMHPAKISRHLVATLLGGVLLLGGAGGAQAGDGASQFSSNISFSFADDNLLKDAGETRKNSPNAYFGQVPSSSLDRVEPSQFRRSSSLLTLKRPFENGAALSPEGALLVRFSPDSNGNYALADFGSYLAVRYLWDKAGNGAATLSFMPVDSDRFRLGRNWDISWGGSNTFPRNFRKGMVPGAKLELSLGSVSAFLGAKTALIRSPSETILDNPGGNSNQLVERAYYAGLAGLAVELPGGLSAGLQGGIFQKGTNTRATVLGKPITAGGGTALLGWKSGGKVGDRMDIRLYYEDPTTNPLARQEGLYEGDLALEASLEGTMLVQTLEDPSQNHSTVNEISRAAGASAGLRYGRFRTHLSLIMRDLNFIVFNVPGLVPYQALPENTKVQPELFGQLSADYFFAGPGLTFGVSGGLLRPATYEATVQGSTYSGPYASQMAQGIHKLVVRGANSGDWSILPAGMDEELVGMLRADLKWNLGTAFSMLAELSYTYDPNLAQVFLNEMGHAERLFDEPNALGVGLVGEVVF
jgi:hypothetical protein